MNSEFLRHEVLGINCYFGHLRVIIDSLLCALSMCSLDRLTIVPLHPGKELRSRKSPGSRDQGARDDEPESHPALNSNGRLLLHVVTLSQLDSAKLERSF